MNVYFTAAFRTVFLSAILGLVVGCAGTPDRPKPAELPPSAGLLGVRLAWTVKSDAVEYPLALKVNGDAVLFASSNGALKSLSALTGETLWSANVGANLSAGIGSDGRMTAVVTVENELVVLNESRVLWRQALLAQGFTAPLVAGGRVFLLAADRSVVAFDAQSGRKLWTQQRTGDSLVLRQSGVLLAVGNTLIAGISGKLVGLNPSNGSVLWEASLSSPRGTNEIERLVDLIGRVSRVGEVVCARSFQSNVGCVDAGRGRVLWTMAASGSTGIDGDDLRIYGAEGNGEIMAWSRADGERVWISDRLKYRRLSSPLVLGRSIVVGDETGTVHWLSREDGTPLGRISTDGSQIAVAPILASGTLVIVTRNGGVFGFKPE
ncbi:outer membrane protein assembly factor BamB [Rhodoferax sp. PAMC 29310]|uniref:outer membrane protein assembly factor BamB n=1 Tax=Rhodoferax sp. PAMC 29310 TaxID=2822760 RepID=UPI001B33ADCB|nr:outer membrane protein assembly factor BamB [Rhodoferax sp. PAMC 29310]